MRPLGSAASEFVLPDVTNIDTNVSLTNFSGMPLLVMFICNHCPFVIHVIEKLVELGNAYQAQGFGVIAISANDVENYPQDGPAPMLEFAQSHGFKFPYCYDESQQVARAYGAECTPDFFVYDVNHRLRYRGQMDASRPGNGLAVTGKDLESALLAIRSGDLVSEHQQPSIGCNIKWKSQ
jgi:peroxiredoxin